MKAFNEFRKDNTLLMTWLESIVDILFMLPKKFEEGQQAVSPKGSLFPYRGTTAPSP